MRTTPHAQTRLLLLCILLCGWLISTNGNAGPIVLSGNENKVDLITGGIRVLPNAAPDSLTLLDFGTFPPQVWHATGVVNSVVGPPSNIAISPDGKLALVANSIRVPWVDKTNWVPETQIHVVDVMSRPPRVIGEVTTDLQPSGLSFEPTGRFAVVANRGAGTVQALAINGTSVRALPPVKVCEAADSVSDIAISPDGKMVLASVQKGGYLAMLRLENGVLTLLARKISVYGQPYRVVFTPDGQLALTAGIGLGNGQDLDALSVIEMASGTPRTTSYVPLGTVPESFELSPDGKLAAAVVMEGSNMASTNAFYSSAGAVVLLERRGKTYERVQRLAVGRIPEGVAFTGDGKYLVVQCHADRNLWIFAVRGGQLKDTGQRISVPGMPSSLRAGPVKQGR